MIAYLLHVSVIVAIYIIAASGLGLMVGFTGLVSIMQGAFLGIGAYVYALTALKMGMPLVFCLLTALMVTGLSGWLLGTISIRLKGDYFALVTFALAVILYNMFNNLISITGGPMGISGVPGFFNSQSGFFLMTWGVTVLLLLILKWFVTSPHGRLLKAVREDEILAAAMGKNVKKIKSMAFILAALYACVAGVLYASFISYVDPSGFTPGESIFILAIILIGGAESIQGAIWGSIVLVAIPEILRFFGLPGEIAAGLRQLILGVFIVTIMVFRTRGVAGAYRLY